MTSCSILPSASSVVFMKLSFAKPLANTGMLFRSKSQTTSTLVALVSESVSNRVPVTGPSLMLVCINFKSGCSVTTCRVFVS